MFSSLVCGSIGLFRFYVFFECMYTQIIMYVYPPRSNKALLMESNG